MVVRSRAFRFVVVAIGFFLAWGAVWIALRFLGARQEHLASERIRELGGTTDIDRWGSQAFVNSLGRMGFWIPYNITRVIVSDRDPEKSLALTRQFSQLTILDVRNCKLHDSQLDSLGDLRHLKELDLSDNLELTGASVGAFPFLAELEVLELENTEFGDAGLKQLRRAVNLRRLDLSNTAVTDKGLADLASLPKLEFVRIWSYRDQITDAGLSQLSKSSSLKEIKIFVDGEKVTQRGLENLRQLMPSCSIGEM